MSERGFRLGKKILYSVSNGTQGGRSEVSSLESLAPGPKVIFSNNEGVPDQFTISYVTSPDEGLIAAGTYRTSIEIKEDLL